MKNILLDKFPKLNSIIELASLFKKQSPINISRFAGSLKSLTISTILSEENKLTLLLPTRKEVDELKVELSILGMGERLVVIDEFTTEILQEKITSLNQKDQFILLSTYKLLKTNFPKKTSLEKNTTKLESGGEITYDDLIEYLDMLDYARDKFVGNPGDFSIRGSIIDFWSYSERHPCRVEFDGDFLESIRYFDSESQRSTGKTDVVTLAPNISTSESEELTDVFEYIDESIIFASQYHLEKLFEEPKKIISKTDVDDSIEDELKEEIFEDNTTTEVNEEETKEIEIMPYTLDELLSENVKWIIEQEIGEENRYNIPISEAPIINSNFDLLFNTLTEYASKDFQILIAT
ncbi:MAG: hypothetical protein KAI45_10755 [Melioribacteraceae bacterium]|nr:hypothetical protein [Melioribacteraceae bacterium]